jgi:disease resistance protein RPS2
MASVITGVAANVSSNILCGLWNKAVQVVRMVICLRQAVTDMEAQAQRLDNLIHGINEKLAQEQKPPQRIVKTWLDKADEAITSSRSIVNEYQQHKSCLGCCPNCFCRYRISKHIRDWKLNVAELHSERHSDFPPNEEYGDPTPRTQIPIQTPKFFGHGIQAAQSELERWLTEDTNIRVIGVYGMGGVGKTSLLQTINNSHKVLDSFELIIWVTVSKDHNILNLQDSIANRLNLKNFPDRSNMEKRDDMLYSYLNDKKFLLVLDDMWESLELQRLGVSLNDRGCKIVLSTRNEVVCRQMRVDEITKVEPLTEEEGWQLFCSGAFRNGNIPQGVEDVARKIAGECKGLPLAINVVAASMVNYTYQHEWEHALYQMQNLDDTFYGMHDDIPKKLFQRLKWSYNVLPDYLKTCFFIFWGLSRR